MKIKTILLLICLVFLLGTSEDAFSQEKTPWAVTSSVNYSFPVAGLSDWFKPAPGYVIGVGKYYDNWFIDGLIEYTKFSDENLSGYPKGKLNLELEHLGLLVNGRYHLEHFWLLRPYFNIGGGLYYWKGTRGEIQANADLEPALPYIDKKVLEEWNWGIRSGLGLELVIVKRFGLDLNLAYRLIIGELWPTLQPHIELEGVSGFQTLNLSLYARYYF